MVHMFSDPQWMPETSGSIKPYVAIPGYPQGIDPRTFVTVESAFLGTKNQLCIYHVFLLYMHTCDKLYAARDYPGCQCHSSCTLEPL